MRSIDAISSYFLEFEWKVGKYFTGQDVKRNRILPNPELLKPSIDVFSLHDLFISQIVTFFNKMEDKPNIPSFQYSIIPIAERSGAKFSLLSHYRFIKRFVQIFPNGDIQIGYARMITSLIDFTFIRSLVADCYSPYGPPPYDPPSLFLLDLFRYIDGYQDMSQFLLLVRDKERGNAYRTYAGLRPVGAYAPEGISTDNIPCEGTFSLRAVGSTSRRPISASA